MANKCNAKVERKDGETLDQMMKRFKNAVSAAGVMDDYKKHSYYRSPSVKLQEKRKEARRRRMIEEKKAQRYRRNDD